MLIVTTDSLPGHEIQAVYGHVYGLMSRTPGGGTFLPSASDTLHDLGRLRQEATSHLIYSTRQLGANAVIGMRFQSSSSGTSPWVEICAYGTAVWAVPVTDWARQHYDRMAEAGTVPPLPALDEEHV